MRKIRVASRSALRDTAGLAVRVDGEDIALFKQGEEVFAVRNDCAHQHFSVLHQGVIEKCTVTCPMHGWTYDLRTGKATTGQGRVATFPVHFEGDDVILELEAPL